MNRHQLLQSLLGTVPLARADAPYRLLELKGPDAAEFLHRLCTQDVLSLRDGETKPAAFLDAKGKLLVTCLVFRIGDGFWLEVMADQAERLGALLERYHFTEKVAIALLPAQPVHEVIGPGRSERFEGSAEPIEGGGLVVTAQRRGVRFLRGHGGMIEQSTLHPEGRDEPVPMDPLSGGAAECLRTLAGFVRVGVETEPTTLALEADLDDHISTTKGCYTGQEIVARINTYGHTNRRLCLLLLAPGAPITSPLPLHETEDQLAVGRVMHAIAIPDRSERLGVGYLPKDFQAIGTKLALADGAAVEVIGYEPLPPLPA